MVCGYHTELRMSIVRVKNIFGYHLQTQIHIIYVSVRNHDICDYVNRISVAITQNIRNDQISAAMMQRPEYLL